MNEEILKTIREKFKESQDALDHNRKEALDDLKFSKLGLQWDEAVKRDREAERRPTLTINKMNKFIKEVVNDARENKPQIKVHPVDDKADKQVAEIYSGIIRNIEKISKADIAYDTAIDYAVTSGFGYIRIETDYAYNDSFDQDLLIKRVSNPFTVFEDPNSTEADGSDWMYCFVAENISKDKFKRLYPKAEMISFEGDLGLADDSDWINEDTVRIAEYWEKKEIDDILYLLDDGSKLRESDLEKNEDLKTLIEIGEISIIDQRDIKRCEVKRYITNGVEILREDEWPGMYIPVVPVYGEEFNVEGKRYYQSLIRHAKDCQRNYNYWRSAATEMVALAPKAPFVGKKGSFDSDRGWDTANTQNHPYLEYDGDVPPQRQPFAGMPAGALQESINASDDIKEVTGIFDASLGNVSNETSGAAIYQRTLQGDRSTYNFIDNLSRAIRQVGNVLVDLIPHIYNTERAIKILGVDGEQQETIINKVVDGKVENDITAGKYDLTVNSGPSYATRRQETAYQMVEFIRSFPQAASLMGDLYAKAMDWPGSEEIAERLKAVNPLFQQQQPQQPPPPDPRLIREQQKAQIDRQKGELDIAEKEIDLNIKQVELEKEEIELQQQRQYQPYNQY